MIQASVPLEYNGQRYFVNDLEYALTLLWDELHKRAGGQKITKPKTRIIHTANLRGLEHFYDTFLVMEAFIIEGSENHGKQESTKEKDV